MIPPESKSKSHVAVVAYSFFILETPMPADEIALLTSTLCGIQLFGCDLGMPLLLFNVFPDTNRAASLPTSASVVKKLFILFHRELTSRSLNKLCLRSKTSAATTSGSNNRVYIYLIADDGYMGLTRG